ncbi:MAG: NUDIX hydrolase [Simkania sp.]|nr:NUDIX hydrolase [Simkania sp.]
MQTPDLCHDGLCRDGSFILLFQGKLSSFQKMRLLLGKRTEDGIWELIGGGFDLRDLDAKTAVIREADEEAGIKLVAKQITYFAHMTQKLPKFENEKGHVFYFAQKVNKSFLSQTLLPSEEHSELAWHFIGDILLKGDTHYKTSTLRMTLHLLNYLEDKQFRFGVLKEKVSFKGYEF